MKRITLLSLLVSCFALSSIAKDGYRIQIKFKDVKDSTFFLAHYFAKPLPTIYKSDSGKLDKNGMAVLQSDKPFNGGMYIIMLSDKRTYFEFLLSNGDDMTITVNNSKELPITDMTFKNAPENEDFLKYEKFVKQLGENQQKLQAQLEEAKNSVDSAAIREKITGAFKSLVTFRKDYVKNNPGKLLSKVFSALEVPQVPEGTHYTEDGKVDSNFAYRYYKTHYWEMFDFKEDRLINTPVYDAKLDDYINKIVVPVPDSIINESVWLLAQTRGSTDLFKYTLSWLTHNAESSKLMGMDKVFVYLVENYYMKGDATWLDKEALEKYSKRARDIAPNLIGNVGYDIKMQDTSGKPVALSKTNAKYTILVFWEPTCGHCIKEIPQLDSAYRAANLKAKGVKVFAVCTESNEKAWKEFINKNKLGDWIHVSDPQHLSNYKMMYDVYSTPTIYLLDEKGIIKGKRLDHSNIVTLVDILEKMEKEKTRNTKASTK